MATAIATARLNIPDPKTAKTMSPKMTVGNVISISVTRTVIISNKPPLKPAVIPNSPPTSMARPTADTAMRSETRVPMMTRERTSRP